MNLRRGAQLLLFAAIAFVAALVGDELGVLGAVVAGAAAALIGGLLVVVLWRVMVARLAGRR